MKRICFLPVVLLLTGLLCGCTGQQQNDPSPQEHNHAMKEGTETPKYDHLTVYSPLPESETLLYCSAFRKDTGITVDCIYLPAGEMTARLEQERDNPQASVLLGGSADNYIQLREAGLLEAYQSPELTDVPEAYQDEQGVWNPIYIGTLCFACNTDWFARTGTPMPTCWDDLLSPALAGQIVMATPKSSGTSYTTLATLVQMRGEDKAWEYLKKLDQNVEHIILHRVQNWLNRLAPAIMLLRSCFITMAAVRYWMAIPLRCAVRQTAPAMRSARARLCAMHLQENAKMHVLFLIG